MLVTDGGGAKVVLAAGDGPTRINYGRPVLVTRGVDGVLRPISPDDEVAILIGLAPRMASLLLILWEESPELHGVDEFREVVAAMKGVAASI